jgi:CheY-like chemotaxis protein
MQATMMLRSMGVKTPIVALTTSALALDKELFFQAGIDDFQTKVFFLFFRKASWLMGRIYKLV